MNKVVDRTLIAIIGFLLLILGALLLSPPFIMYAYAGVNQKVAAHHGITLTRWEAVFYQQPKTTVTITTKELSK